MTVPQQAWNRWRKATASGGGDSCVEVRLIGEGAGVRDSKDPDAGNLTVSLDAFRAFVERAKND
jgi:hypothetical protein